MFIVVCALAYKLGSAVNKKPKQDPIFHPDETSAFQESLVAWPSSGATAASIRIATSVTDPPPAAPLSAYPKPDAAATISPRALENNPPPAPLSGVKPAQLSEDSATRLSTNLRNAGEDTAQSLPDRAIAGEPNVSKTRDPSAPPRVVSPVPTFKPDLSVPANAKSYQAPDVAATLRGEKLFAELRSLASPRPPAECNSCEPRVTPDVRATVAPGAVVHAHHPAPVESPAQPLIFEGVRPDVRATLPPA
ncbi:hypothetical protein HYPDE_39248 [Hyphomicrobium denitrificans 1NES1]|uniref:Uncharacterized protein n=1 Tax=Hyphomicrobium denitrificans 1NES1 TaxID=670307 RepID=N0B7E2_9HYPH|nr:hypothetical protein HYPDE_39248 [Hyphomicrobium denitrificans 1NES1]